ncbi:MAG: hypothetical protein M1812_007207 [Candelaria pacifica]|nr:MAG: hypothetical protein M1812_007207 [Candelaria pacifica]
MSLEAGSYFVPGFNISRAVLQSNICYYLGPEAIVRPYTHQGRDGFLVTAPGKPLTKRQIDDLITMSKQWEEQAAARMSSDAEEENYVNRPVPVAQRERRRR